MTCRASDRGTLVPVSFGAGVLETVAFPGTHSQVTVLQLRVPYLLFW